MKAVAREKKPAAKNKNSTIVGVSSAISRTDKSIERENRSVGWGGKMGTHLENSDRARGS